jgi:hypothetical protein
MKNLIISTLLVLASLNLFSQGTPHVKVFSNFNYDLSAEDNSNPFKAFELKRAYLGYGHDLSDNFNVIFCKFFTFKNKISNSISNV